MVNYKAAYFVVPASFVSKMKFKIDSGTDHLDDGEPIIISSGNLDPTKHYEIVELLRSFSDYVVGDRVTGLNNDIIDKAVVRQVSSLYPLKNKLFSAGDCGVTDSGKYVVLAMLEPNFIKEVRRFTRLEDITSQAALLAIKLKNAYLGKTPQDVFDKIPEMAEVTIIDDIETPRFHYSRWSFDD